MTNANLALVSVGLGYRPALPISQRPELAAAFARGEARRASGDKVDETQMQWLMAASEDERTAYQLGLAGPKPLDAPAPLAISLALLLANGVAEDLVRGPYPRYQKLPRYAAVAVVVVGSARVSKQAQRRRARALGLTAETTPTFAIGCGPLLAQLALVGIHRLWLRRRLGRWPRVSPSSALAATAVRELQRRRAWNAAYERGRLPT